MNEKLITGRASPRHQYGTLMWKAINAIMSLFFFLCSIVQFNDPDPYLWVPYYAIPACLCACIVWMPDVVENSLWKIAALFHLGISCFSLLVLILQIVHYFQEEIINPLRFEEGREILGVTITIGWILICRCCNPKRSDGGQQVGVMMSLVIVSGLLPFVVWATCCLTSFHHCGDMCQSQPR
ncbi:transmembrane protein 220-like isoform X1 [Anneissia japonica]|uniref:transmembrane protein 220-like isoform X1 n=1 Tax=Anneissia japonica TaxID=1529436 RepID=UPI0014257D63|nr:transmembrane protein 220-like isoform X1 [Anneissia japonica]XP_033120401.1 transmembrane protein 220-like isoform X1 [Anneissia japonica]XP_033120402.1 transmembrane protein 220-like isoform X1 [Anneissia japonica]XP_033120404.1 transmembrane protein 220-like isoform X1 [Anneissia japonica]XP_033120405.1 transmembrane protein 220-like isoform X1 [Anneissia japonica]